jgi:lipoate-protein ligase A
MNMAIDEAIALSCREGNAPPTLRLYQWTIPSISLGYFQRAHEVLNWQVCQQQGIRIVRRSTGGRAVYHDRELTYSIASPAGTVLFGKNLKETFFQIARGFAKGLEKLGIDVSLSERATPGSRRSPLCFSSPSWYEITVRGRKLMGSAQRRWADGFLQHGSLLLEDQPDLYLTLFRFPSEQARQKSLLEYKEKTISLSDLLDPIPSLAQLKESIRSGFEAEHSIHFKEGDLLPREGEAVSRLLRERYGRASWNLGTEKESH